ncbi:hypothetical protein BSU01_04840 [Erwinia billingiae]|nr:hypothetical protein [Erwinia billingiae]
MIAAVWRQAGQLALMLIEIIDNQLRGIVAVLSKHLQIVANAFHHHMIGRGLIFTAGQQIFSAIYRLDMHRLTRCAGR